jgi:hypothetical protein
VASGVRLWFEALFFSRALGTLSTQSQIRSLSEKWCEVKSLVTSSARSQSNPALGTTRAGCLAHDALSCPRCNSPARLRLQPHPPGACGGHSIYTTYGSANTVVCAYLDCAQRSDTHEPLSSLLLVDSGRVLPRSSYSRLVRMHTAPLSTQAPPKKRPPRTAARRVTVTAARNTPRAAVCAAAFHLHSVRIAGQHFSSLRARGF